MSADSASLAMGQMVGKYRLDRLLGSGGMGQVYLGIQPAIGSRVAIKVLSGEHTSDPTAVERFFNEARAVNLIQHENIVNVLDMDRLPDGRPYLVMEYLAGATLAALIEGRGPLPLGGLARLMGEVLTALAAAHRHQIVHRDLKPDNVIVSRGGHAKILDFGVAKLMGDPTVPALTQTGLTVGTPHYMAPEQVRASGVDARTDLYAAGVMLYEGVTGRRPFSGSSLFELFRQVVDTAPPWPHKLRPGLPQQLEAVIMRALEKDPTRRFSSAKEMAHHLRAAAEQLPSQGTENLNLADELGETAYLPQAGSPAAPAGPAAATAVQQASPGPAHPAVMPPDPTVPLSARRAPASDVAPTVADVAPAVADTPPPGPAPGAAFAAGPVAATSPALTPAPLTPAPLTPPVTPAPAPLTPAPLTPPVTPAPAPLTPAPLTPPVTPAPAPAPVRRRSLLLPVMFGLLVLGSASGAGIYLSTRPSADPPPAPEAAVAASGAGSVDLALAAPGSASDGSHSDPAVRPEPQPRPQPAPQPRAVRKRPRWRPLPGGGAPRGGAPRGGAPRGGAPRGGPTSPRAATPEQVAVTPPSKPGQGQAKASPPAKAPTRSGVIMIETKGTSLRQPIHFNPRSFNPLGYLGKARTLARKLMSDAVLIDFDVEGVFPDGHVDLTLRGDYRANFAFRSPSRSKKDPKLPSNVEQEIRCLVYVEVSSKQVEVHSTTSNKSCKEKPRPRWRCSLAQAWKLARAEGAPKGNVVAKVSWLWDGWYFDFGKTSMSVRDRCR